MCSGLKFVIHLEVIKKMLTMRMSGLHMLYTGLFLPGQISIDFLKKGNE
jgi:hypothetical protein